jgi:lysophospholipase L1-like esterase
MSSHHLVLVLPAIACFSVGLGVGIGLAIARSGKIRDLARRMGRPDFYQQWCYDQTVKFHKRIDACVPGRAVIFVGDSFIQGLCVTEIVAGGINYGIGGDTTAGVLKRLPSYQSISRASAVVLAVGDNDLRPGCEESMIVENYKAILAQIPEQVSVLFCSLTPYGERAGEAQANQKIINLNRLAVAVCSSRSHCYFIDLYNPLVDANGHLRAQFDDGDGVHLNGEGNRLCIERIRAALSQSVSSLEPKGFACSAQVPENSTATSH